MSPREEENRRIWALGEPRRADRGLRVFGERIGHAVMCPRCGGDGVVVGRELASADPRNPYSRKVLVTQPVPCPTCNGEGLDPQARQGEER